MPKKYSEEYKQNIIQDYQNGVTIQKISQINNVAISTIYRWLKDYEDETPVPHYAALLRKKEHLEHVLEVIHLSGLIDEVPLRRRLDILETLHTQHEEYNVHELCEALNVARGTFYNHKKRQEYQRKNLLEQNFTASRQNEIWVSDITYFKVKDYSVYFCVIIALFSRKIVGYHVSRKCSVQLVSSTFKKAFQNRDILMTMRWRKPSSQHLREKRLTAMNILRKQISEKRGSICQLLQPCPSPSNVGVQGSSEV